MDEKWNIFVLNQVLYFSRSWTNNCIFKIFFDRAGQNVLLRSFQVNRNAEQYKGTDIEDDTITLIQLLQNILKRDDFYKDPQLEKRLIKQTIEKTDPENLFTRSAGTSKTSITRQLYQTLVKAPNDQFFDIKGWDELEQNLAGHYDDEKLISLNMQHKQDCYSRTFYFNKEVTELLGEVTIKKKPDSKI